MATAAGRDHGNAEPLAKTERFAELPNPNIRSEIGVPGKGDRGQPIFLQQVFHITDLFQFGVTPDMLGPARHRGQLDAGESCR